MDQGQPRITNMTPDTHFPAGGRPEQGYRVEFTTPSGIRSHVIVARSDDLPAHIHDAVMRESDMIEQTLLEHGYQPRSPGAR